MKIETNTVILVLGFLGAAAFLLFLDYILKICFRPLFDKINGRPSRIRKHDDSAATTTTTNYSTVLHVGIVGSSSRPFNKAKAAEAIRNCYDRLSNAAKATESELEIISGLTAQGIPALAYQEAVKRGWLTAGIACSKANDLACFPCDRVKIVGSEWGDESQSFLNECDVLVAIGSGGPQAQREYAQFAKLKMRFDIDSPNGDVSKPVEILNFEESPLSKNKTN